MQITSPRNERVKLARQVREGRDKSLLFVEGARLARDCVASGLGIAMAFHSPDPPPAIDSLLADLRARGVELLETAPDVLASLGDTVTTQGIILLAQRPAPERAGFWQKLPASPLLLALDRIQDPGNLGTLLRTAEAAGAHGVLTLAGSADPFAPKTLRASMGSAFRLPMLTGLSNAELLAAGATHSLRLAAAAGTGAVPYREHDWTAPTLLLLGNEAQGVAPDLIEACAARVRIPMQPCVESLNVAAAAAVLLFEAAHQRALTAPS